MRVLNVMLGRGRGGIEQASLDYALALAAQGVEVCTVLAPNAAIAPVFAARGLKVATQRHMGPWDWFARRRLHGLWQAFGAEVAIAHGNRALALLAGGPGRLVNVIHNYRLQHLHLADAVIGVTPALAARAVEAGFDPERVLALSNMLETIPPLGPSTPRERPVIGALGRFVAKKGFHTYLEALALLRARGIPFRAVLGGAGEEEPALRAQATRLGLDELLHWAGWVEDTAAFYRGLDIFCVPSVEEPFGIVLLEAFAHGVAVVASDAEGPREIVGDRATATLFERGSPSGLAEALQRLLEASEPREQQRGRAHADVATRYGMPIVGARLAGWLESLVRAGCSKDTKPSPT